MEWNTGFEPAHRLWRSRMLPLHQSHIKVKKFGNSTFTAYVLKSTNAISHVLFLTNTLNTPEFHCFLFVSSYNTPSNIHLCWLRFYILMLARIWEPARPRFINTCFIHNDMTETVSVIIMPKRKHSYRILFSAFRYYYAPFIFPNPLCPKINIEGNTRPFRWLKWMVGSTNSTPFTIFNHIR